MRQFRKGSQASCAASAAKRTQFLRAALASYMAVSAAAMSCCGDCACAGKEAKPKRAPARELVSGDALADALGHLQAHLKVSFGEHDDELVAAVASDNVCVAHRREYDRGHLHQDVRADEVAVSVVDLLEVVEV